jgi:hypothetical protein
MSATANEPAPPAPPPPDISNPERPNKEKIKDPEKGRVPPVAQPGHSEHPKQ